MARRPAALHSCSASWPTWGASSSGTSPRGAQVPPCHCAPRSTRCCVVDGVGHDPVHAQALAEHRAQHVQGALDVGRPAQRPLHVQGQLVHHQALRLLEVQPLVVLQQPVEVRGQVTDLGDLLVLARAAGPGPRSFWRATTACSRCQRARSSARASAAPRRPRAAIAASGRRAATTTVSRFRLSTVATRPASRCACSRCPTVALAARKPSNSGLPRSTSRLPPGTVAAHGPAGVRPPVCGSPLLRRPGRRGPSRGRAGPSRPARAASAPSAAPRPCAARPSGTARAATARRR